MKGPKIENVFNWNKTIIFYDIIFSTKKTRYCLDARLTIRGVSFDRSGHFFAVYFGTSNTCYPDTLWRGSDMTRRLCLEGNRVPHYDSPNLRALILLGKEARVNPNETENIKL